MSAGDEMEDCMGCNVQLHSQVGKRYRKYHPSPTDKSGVKIRTTQYNVRRPQAHNFPDDARFNSLQRQLGLQASEVVSIYPRPHPGKPTISHSLSFHLDPPP